MSNPNNPNEFNKTLKSFTYDISHNKKYDSAMKKKYE